jgi:hypothetical protein
MMNDIVLIKIPRAMGPGIPWQYIENQTSGFRTYMGGYPMPVQRELPRGRAGRSAVNNEFVWTLGNEISNESFLAGLARQGKDPGNYSFAASGAYRVLLSNDGAAGMSGSPIFNSQGSVVGIFGAILPKDDKPESQNGIPLVAIGTNTDGLLFLKYLVSP